MRAYDTISILSEELTSLNTVSCSFFVLVLTCGIDDFHIIDCNNVALVLPGQSNFTESLVDLLDLYSNG